MTSIFTPSKDINASGKEKEWAASLGMLDWDSTSIVFTKRSLIEFLKYTGTTVDTNFGNISKLPRYAKFGKLSEPGPAESVEQEPEAADEQTSSQANSGDSFKPSRRVRTAPGGNHTDIFAADDDDALSLAPPKGGSGQTIHAAPAPQTVEPEADDDDDVSGIRFTSSVIPSRRVREQPGGRDSLSNLWDTADETKDFKPTRRVRDAPGGRDNISGIF